jgi:hypothetical protein
VVLSHAEVHEIVEEGEHEFTTVNELQERTEDLQGPAHSLQDIIVDASNNDPAIRVFLQLNVRATAEVNTIKSILKRVV